MTADRSATVMVVEPAAMFADVIADALTALDYDAKQVVVPPNDLCAEADRIHASIVVIGPSFGRSGLVAAMPEMLAHGVRTVLISPQSLDRIDASILMAGASGFLSAATNDIADVAVEVSRVVSGSSPLHPNVVHAMLRLWRDSKALAESDEQRIELTPREIDVVRGLRDGLTTRLLAARLGVTEKTVEAHKSRLFAKVGARNSSQALQLVSAQRLA